MALIAWWPLNGDLKDVSGSRKDGTSLGTLPLDNNGKIGKTYLFQNNDNGVNIANNNFAGLKEYTMCAWICPMGNHRNYNGTVLSSGNWNSKAWAFGVSQNNTQIDVAGRGYNKYIDCNVPVNQWTHILCIVKDGASKLYVNGNYIGQRSVTTELWSDATNTCIGRETYASGHFSFNGKINDVRIYDNAISVKEAKEIAKCKILHYDFNECAEPTVNRAGSVYLGFGGARWEKVNSFPSLPFKKETDVYRRKDTNTYFGYASDFFTPSEISSPTNGKKYSVSMWYYRASSNAPLISVGVYGNNGSSTYAGCANVSYIGNRSAVKEWTYLKCIITLATTGIVNLTYLPGTGGSTIEESTNIWITNFQFEEKDHCTPFIKDSRSNSTVIDKSGFNNHSHEITLPESPFWVDERVVGSAAYRFDGSAKTSTGQYQHFGTKTNLLIPQQGTMGFWIKHEGATNGDNKYAVGYSHFCSMNNSGIMGLIYYYDGGNYTTRTTSATFYDSQWHHYCVTWDTINNKLRLYRDGIKLSEQAPGSMHHVGTYREFLVGNAWGTSYGGHSGYIDDVRVYATALSDEDVKSLYSVRGSISKKGELFIDEIKEDIDNTILTIDDITIGNLTATGVSFPPADSNGIRTLTNTGNSGTYRLNMPLDKLTPYNGETLTISFKYAFDGGSESDFYFTDWCDTSIVKQTSGGKMYCQGSYGTYTSIYRFIDGQINSGTKVRIWDLKLSRGAIPKHKATITKKGQLEAIEILENTFKPTCVDYSQWTKASAPGWSNNGSASENTRVVHPNPVGDMDIMWASLTNDTASDGDGGFVSPMFAIDKTKKYRYSIWIRRENCGGGRTYFGCYGYDASGTNGQILNLSNSAANTNPYFTNFLKNEFGGATDNKWALLVAYIHPHTYTGTSSDPTNGVYSLSGTRMGGVTDYKWSTTATQAKTRSYLYYSVDVNERQYFYRPRVEICDGSEPSIKELLTCSEHIPLSAIVERPNPIGIFSLGKNGQSYATKFIEST